MNADFDTIEKDLSSRKMAEKGTKTGLPWSIADFGSPVFFVKLCWLSLQGGGYLPSKNCCGGKIKKFGFYTRRIQLKIGFVP